MLQKVCLEPSPVPMICFKHLILRLLNYCGEGVPVLMEEIGHNDEASCRRRISPIRSSSLHSTFLVVWSTICTKHWQMMVFWRVRYEQVYPGRRLSPLLLGDLCLGQHDGCLFLRSRMLTGGEQGRARCTRRLSRFIGHKCLKKEGQSQQIVR